MEEKRMIFKCIGLVIGILVLAAVMAVLILIALL